MSIFLTGDIHGKQYSIKKLAANRFDAKSPTRLTRDDYVIILGDFGLVWDGDSLDTCSGDFGEYLRWNSPHKVSFCLRAGLPVIIWREAAVASIIEELGIGLCIDSLRELNDLLQQITSEQMQTMRRNVKAVSDRLKDGQFLKKAMQTIG